MLPDRYEPQSLMRRGPTTTDYTGIDRQTGRPVIIKVLNEEYSIDPKFVKCFQMEAQAALQLHHPHIAEAYDYGESGGKYFMVMEMVEGTDLRRYLRSLGVLDVDRAVSIAYNVALGLGVAHRRNIMHRNVQPRNILLGHEGTVKLANFSTATIDMMLGIVHYYAPEQAKGEIVTPAADVYSLGIVLYELLTGRLPFDGETPVAIAMQHIQDTPFPPSRFNPGIPPGLEDIILRCLEKVPEKRFRDGSELAEALSGFQAGR